MLALISVTLVAIWNLIYFVFIYKKDSFYAGMGDIPTNTYTKQSKKTWIFTMLAETVILMVTFTYFICVAEAYKSGMHHEGVAWVDPDAPVEEEEKPVSETKSEAKPAEGEGEGEGEGDAAPAEGE
jgi:hypothetical protein